MSNHKKVNIRYAIGEILLIFIGISLALSFDTWNDNRILAKQEKATLIEIREGIKNDVSDMKENISGHTTRLELFDLLVTAIENNHEVSPKIDSLFTYFSGSTSFITNRAPYEMLKARGIDIISNSALRQSILEYYDIKQDWIVSNEKDHIDHYREYTKPLLLKHVDFRTWKPRHYHEFMYDEETLPILHWARQTDGYILRLYLELESYAEALLVRLEEEI